MELFLIIISLILALGVVLLLSRPAREKMKVLFMTKLKSEKEKRKKEILEILKEKKKVSNKELRKKLGVSKRSVVRYMDELEKQGKVAQVGKTGRNAYYSLK